MKKINKIIIHAADTPADMDIGAKEINQWHLDRGWSGIGYHWVIRRDGTVEQGRSSMALLVCSERTVRGYFIVSTKQL